MDANSKAFPPKESDVLGGSALNNVVSFLIIYNVLKMSSMVIYLVKNAPWGTHIETSATEIISLMTA